MYALENATIGSRRPQSESAPIPDFYPRLEALRGIAALSVAAFHSWQSRWLDSAGSTRSFLSPTTTDGFFDQIASLALRIAGNGHGAVILFFVISGFVLTGSLARGPQDYARGGTRFLLARLFRIYPAAVATIAVFALVFWAFGASFGRAQNFGPIALVENALLIDTSINGVMWTLQVELIAGPLLLIAYFGFQRFGIAPVVALFCILAALSFWGPWMRAIGGANMFGTIHAFIPGMIAFLTAPRLLRSCTPRTATLVLAIASIGFLASRPVLSWTSNWAVIAEASFGAIAVAVLAFGRPGAFATIFDWRLTRFFGRISYSFYLLHPLTLLAMWKNPSVLGAVIAMGVSPLALAIILFVTSVAVITPLAFALYRWVERPGIAANRTLARLLLARPPKPNTAG
jgi:peptidoglycan/LPS O-acetylase OafA/YrhL